jgi:pimeloyl-ACP methyl ester carboxylesterase
VAIHPEFGDESTLVDMYVGADGKTSMLAEEARKRGYVVLLPGAGRTFEWFDESSPAGVGALVRRFIETWPIDPQQVYLWGHSLGGAVALRLLQIQKLWAGVAVVGVSSVRNYDFRTPANVPLAILAGTADQWTTVQQVLVLSYRLKPVVTTQEFVRLESQDHWSSGPAAIRPSFEFFDKVRQGKLAPPAPPAQPVKPQD